jgi:hypothetical protein
VIGTSLSISEKHKLCIVLVSALPPVCMHIGLSPKLQHIFKDGFDEYSMHVCVPNDWSIRPHSHVSEYICKRILLNVFTTCLHKMR